MKVIKVSTLLNARTYGTPNLVVRYVPISSILFIEEGSDGRAYLCLNHGQSFQCEENAQELAKYINGVE